MAQRREKGTGSVTQRKDGLWHGRIDAGIKPDGKRDVRSVYAKTEAECKRKLRELRREINRTEYVHVQRSTVRNYMEGWLANVKKNELKPKSYDRLEQTLTLHVYPYIGHLQLDKLNSDDIQKMINELRDKNYSYSTIKKAYEAVNACFKHGVIQKTVAKNPAVGVTVPSKKLFPQQKIHFYTEEEAKLLIEQSQKKYKNGKRIYPLGSMVQLLVNTGLRMGELLALRWKPDIDFENRTLTVHHSIAFVKDRSDDALSKHKIIEQDSVKTDAGQDRIIPLNDGAINALNDLYQVTGNNTYVMSTKNGTIVSPRNADRIFRRIVAGAGFPEEKIYGLHSLRHTFATFLLTNGVDIKTVSVILGHSDVSITYNTYIHVIKEQKAKAVNSIPDLLNSN